MTDQKLTHIDDKGDVRMVDVSAKPDTERIAVAEGSILMHPETLALIVEGKAAKGDVLACAKIGGIMAAKRASQLIPLCHSLNLSYADIRFEVRDMPPQVRIEAEARTVGNTGVEMEAIVAAQSAAAIIYDMCKAVQRDIVISRVRLLHKSGGKSGEFNASELPA